MISPLFVPPLRFGVGASCVVLSAHGQATLLDAIAQQLPGVSRQEWMKRFAQGGVFDVTGQAVNAASPFAAGVRLYYYRDVPNEPVLPFQAAVLYQDANIVVADKPHFMPVVPSGPYLHHTLLVRLRQELDLPDLTPVHRIDRDTAGLVFFCINRNHRNAYQALFRERKIIKKYLAVAPWRSEYAYPIKRESRIVRGEPFFRCTEVAGDANAETSIEVLKVHGKYALYRLIPLTGQRHQLRVHMHALGMPILQDAFYPVVNDPSPGDYSRPLQLLAQELAFLDPITSRQQHFYSQRRLQMQDLDQAF